MCFSNFIFKIYFRDPSKYHQRGVVYHQWYMYHSLTPSGLEPTEMRIVQMLV